MSVDASYPARMPAPRKPKMPKPGPKPKAAPKPDVVQRAKAMVDKIAERSER